MADDNTIQPVTDDAELAKVLDGMKTDQSANLNFEETPGAPTSDDPTADNSQPASDDTSAPDIAPPDVPTPDTIAPMPGVTNPTTAMSPSPTMPSLSGVRPELDSIKKSALEELRPLVDKLNLPASEKFDTLLLIIRSTDDQALVSQAYEAARAIEDEQKRAEALLDIIKEIDYFANPQASS